MRTVFKGGNMFKVIKMENAYGIKKINFNIGNDTDNNLLIYSPNGTFKTSFTKSLKRISDGEKPEDLIFSTMTQYEVQMESKVFKQNILQPFDEIVFYSEEINRKRSIVDSDFSALVANDEAKEKYQKKANEYKEKLQLLVKEIALKFFTKSKKDKERLALELLSNAFETDGNWETFFSNVSKEKFRKFEFPYKYKELFDDSVYSVITDDSFQKDVNVYLETITSKVDSPLFRGQFGPQEAENVLKAFKDNFFFDEELSINLRDKTTIKTIKDFEEVITKETEKLFKDPEVKAAYDMINEKLRRNTSTRNFSRIIKKDFRIINELRKPSEFRKRVILSLLSDLSGDIISLDTLITEVNRELYNIVDSYKDNRLLWDEILKEFNERFEFPLEVDIANRNNAIIGIEVPVFKFTYVDGTRRKGVSENQLNEFLSTGEKNVFSILNFLLELKIKILNYNRTIVVVDDIVDSFDYKNKYATVAYLDELSRNTSIQMLIMTHNFDFYRTMSRSEMKKYIAFGINGKITLEPFVDFSGFTTLKNWKKYYKNDNVKIANYYSLIPFARSLEELRNGDSRIYKVLTKALHYKQGFEEKKFWRLFGATEKSIGFIPWRLANKKVYQSLFDVCDVITESSRTTKAQKKLLQDKLVISIGIRILFEKKVISKYSLSKVFLSSIKVNQTRAIVKKLENIMDPLDQTIANKVMVYTPEFIHINTFMIEPIIDLSIENLVSLYTEVRDVL